MPVFERGYMQTNGARLRAHGAGEDLIKYFMHDLEPRALRLYYQQSVLCAGTYKQYQFY
jgi:hypothetical protein